MHPPPLPYQPHPDNAFGETEEGVDRARTATPDLSSSRYNNRDPLDPIRHEDPAQESFLDVDAPSGHTTVGLFRDAVEAARQSIEQSLAGGEEIGEAVSLKLTLDLSSQALKVLPDEVVDLIKRDVERLKLSHNQIWHIPIRFQECTVLKYLNLRGNRFKEFPKAVFHLPQLEIFDLSRNKLTRIPDDVQNMKALRVLSVSNNNIESVSLYLATMENVKILKMDGNPLNPDLKRIIDEGANSPPQTNTAHNDREYVQTEKVKTYLRTAEAAAHNFEEDSSSDGLLDTPRAPKRIPSSRFPVRPNNSGSESVSDMNGRSPGFAKPPIPMRSHYRIPSGQNESPHSTQNAALRRPGLAPLAIGNERNRSNSESILQATQNNRNKRMGIIKKKQSGLGKVDEIYTNRNSFHFRGQSHGSALHDRSNTGVKNTENSLSSPLSADDSNGTFVRRLSSLPEYKRVSVSPSHLIEGAKGVLYSLHQVHPHIAALIPVVKDSLMMKKSNLERVHFCATNQLEVLDNTLHEFEQSPKTEESRGWSHSNVVNASEAVIVAYQQVGEHLLLNIARLVAGGDQRYIRTMMLLLYASSIEARNACWSLAPTVAEDAQPEATHSLNPIVSEEPPSRPDRSLTPTRERPNPERRRRNGTTSHQPGYFTPASSGAQTAVPLYVNGRSRSNSRAGGFINSNASSIANTPRTGESFMVPGTPQIRSRSNSAFGQYSHSTHHLPDGSAHDAYFEKIYDCLGKAINLGKEKIPVVLRHSSQCLDVAQTSDKNKPFVNLWSALILRSQHCLDMCEILSKRLQTIKLNDPEVRHARDFWRLCTKLFDAVTKLFDGVKEARRLEVIAREMVMTIQPILKAVREASHLVYTSPWAHLVEAETTERAATAQDLRPTNGVHPPEYTQQQNLRYRSRTGSGNSPYQTSIPATPLSAALGPAVQATVPTSASLDRSFAGDVFQRAEEFLRVQQTIVPRR